MTEILAIIVTGLFSVITTLVTASKNNALQDERINSLKTELLNLASKVEKHNNFGLEIAQMKTEIANIKESIKEIRK